MASEQLNTLVADISAQAEAVVAQLAASVEPLDHQALERAHRSLSKATQALSERLASPHDFLEEMQVNYQRLACFQVMLRFNVLERVPRDGASTPIAQLAEECKIPLARLKSTTRMLMTCGFLQEPQADQIAHSRLSLAYVQQPELFDIATFITDYSAPTAQHFAAATLQWGETYAENETAANLAFKTELPFFEYVKGSPEMTAHFSRYMRALSLSPGLSLQHIADGFGWADLGEALIVDVGGSTGQVANFLAERLPKLSFITQDLPETVRQAPSPPPEIASRVTLEGHDFFTPQAKVADVYFMRRILHDWPFEQAREILQHLAVAMKPRSRIVIMDNILPRQGEIPAYEEAKLRLRDLVMAQSFNSKERELCEWEDLFASTQPKLRLRGHKIPPGSTLAVMEVVLEADQ